MRDKLCAYVEGLFRDAPDTPQVREVREEILQNTLNRYDDQIASGVGESAAYQAAVSGIGDVEALLASFGVKKPEKPNKSVARRVCVAVAVALYILCVVPVILCDELQMPDALGVSLMFLMVAVATALLVFTGGHKASKTSETTAIDAQPMQQQPHGKPSVLRCVLTPIYWVVTTAVFLFLGFRGYWHVAWLVFLAAGGIGDIIKGIAYMCLGRSGGEPFVSGCLLLMAIWIYLTITLKTQAWAITWMVFPIYAALTGIVSGIFTLARGGKR